MMLDLYFVEPGSGACRWNATQCLKNRPFSIEYPEFYGDEWSLDIPSVHWEF